MTTEWNQQHYTTPRCTERGVECWEWSAKECQFRRLKKMKTIALVDKLQPFSARSMWRFEQASGIQWIHHRTSIGGILIDWVQRRLSKSRDAWDAHSWIIDNDDNRDGRLTPLWARRTGGSHNRRTFIIQTDTQIRHTNTLNDARLLNKCV